MVKLLDQIHVPADVRRLSRLELKQLATELREFVVQTVAQTGGHFSSNLGTVELTIALHYVFDTPHDRIVWDVGHQTYPHKTITGRKDRMSTLRQLGGISGFTLPVALVAAIPVRAIAATFVLATVTTGLGAGLGTDLGALRAGGSVTLAATSAGSSGAGHGTGSTEVVSGFAGPGVAASWLSCPCRSASSMITRR